jgi:hypothetical protein
VDASLRTPSIVYRAPCGCGSRPETSGENEEADPDVDVFGLGKIENSTWKGLRGTARSQPGPFEMIRREILCHSP